MIRIIISAKPLLSPLEKPVKIKRGNLANLVYPRVRNQMMNPASSESRAFGAALSNGYLTACMFALLTSPFR